MTPDGTITSFHPDRRLITAYCTPASGATFAGTAGSTEIRVQMTDRATCVDGLGRPRDTDRTYTIAVSPRRAAMSME
jgi:hypothetical protein